MSSTTTLFEISWEICNKVGGIHTVLSTKAKTLVERYGDEYVAIGPWLLSDTERELPFDEEGGFEAFCESCRQAGVPVRVGRWRIPGAPRTILVESSGLYDQKDDILSELWEGWDVDSLKGEWDYHEPVLFGYAAGIVIERWWEDYLAPHHRRAVVQAHEWMTGSALLYLRARIPNIGTVFTTHATMLGRALSSLGCSPDDGLGDKTPAELAEEHGVVAKHSLEGVCARQADVFTTVSEITAKEAALLHNRTPDPLLFNGIDLDVVDTLAGPNSPESVRTRLRQVASKLVGEDLSDAALFCSSGRYEFHNKGFDVLLDAVQRMNDQKGRRLVLFMLVPSGNSGVRAEVRERLEKPLSEIDGPAGLCTHNLFDKANDPIAAHCAEIGFENAPGARVQVIHVPIYLDESDGFLDLPYEAVLRAMDLSCFASYYEPWGYTPQESLAVGVPTVTSDYAGFGRWAKGEGLGYDDGLTILDRVHVEYDDVVAALTTVLERALRDERSRDDVTERCRAAAARTSWSTFVSNYSRAFQSALDEVGARMARGVPVQRRPRLNVPVQPAPEGLTPRLVTFDVSATLPEALRGLERLAWNYWWSWDPDARALFEQLSPPSWEACGHNPVQLLRRVFPEDLVARADDKAYVTRLQRVLSRLDDYLANGPKPIPVAGGAIDVERPIAYFCAEYGLHESLRIYSGGLGILAGDHLKSASDIGLPLIAVGLFYRMGYFSQSVSAEGEQLAGDLVNDPRDLPLERVLSDSGEPLEVRLKFPGRDVYLGAWKAKVGRVTLYLLDANLSQNRPEDRDITRNLYGGDNEMRLRQEIVLGRGGERVLRALGIAPAGYHINEGHGAFLMLERVALLVGKHGFTFEEAREHVRATTAFTTHTPVPAGHDRFPEELVRRYFSDAEQWTGVPWGRFYGFGQTKSDKDGFNVTYLALNFSSWVNGVSRLHGVASRNLLAGFWPGLLESELPVTSVTNGVHLATWTDPALAAELGAEERAVRGEDFATKAGGMPLTKLWAVRQAAKERLMARLQRSLQASFTARHDSPLVLARILDGLDENALWIGFARRFAPYKRAHLLFQDLDRLAAILGNPERPVRLVIAGKAHPNDQLGKDLLKGIVERSRSDELVGKVIFAEGYDIDLARALVQGVDVWLNNPVRMQEASGTSGMKVAANGGLNLSIADGWWPEGFDGDNGWTIADGRVYDDQELQNQLDAASLYRLLEEEIVPLWFDRGRARLPRRWLERVRHSLETIPPLFDTDRMVGEYRDEAYCGIAESSFELSLDRPETLRKRVAELERLRRGFEGLVIRRAQIADLTSLNVGDAVEARVEIELGSLKPDDVAVELVYGHAKSNGTDPGGLHQPVHVELAPVGPGSEGSHAFEGSRAIERSGQYAYGLRVRARLADEPERLLVDLVRWA